MVISKWQPSTKNFQKQVLRRRRTEVISFVTEPEQLDWTLNGVKQSHPALHTTGLQTNRLYAVNIFLKIDLIY